MCHHFVHVWEDNSEQRKYKKKVDHAFTEMEKRDKTKVQRQVVSTQLAVSKVSETYGLSVMEKAILGQTIEYVKAHLVKQTYSDNRNEVVQRENKAYPNQSYRYLNINL